jgi:molybdopterin-guanine dinucleotide biosynthesis protein B
MSIPRAVAVVGFKDSGKTRVVEALVKELTGRGKRVGTIKHTAEEVPLDTPGKDTWRHREAGSRASAIMHERGAAFFIDRHFTVNEAVAMLGGLDFVIVEGFKSLSSLAKIMVPRETKEIESLSSGLEIAIVEVPGVSLRVNCSVPVIPLEHVSELADLVEVKSFKLLPGLNCGGCGYDECMELARAILSGDAGAEKCAGYGSGGFVLRVDDQIVPLGPFVREVTMNVVLGLVKSFKGVKEPSKVELMFEVHG